MSRRVWHKGPPPHVGWWNTKVEFSDPDFWGWWNGWGWSVFADSRMSAKLAASRAAMIGAYMGATSHVEWSQYWPKNARVPRIDPSKQKGKK